MGNSVFLEYFSFLVCMFGRDGEDSTEDRDCGRDGEGRDGKDGRVGVGKDDGHSRKKW